MHAHKTQLEIYFLVICMPLSSHGFPIDYPWNCYRNTILLFSIFVSDIVLLSGWEVGPCSGGLSKHMLIY